MSIKIVGGGKVFNKIMLLSVTAALVVGGFFVAANVANATPVLPGDITYKISHHTASGVTTEVKTIHNPSTDVTYSDGTYDVIYNVGNVRETDSLDDLKIFVKDTDSGTTPSLDSVSLISSHTYGPYLFGSYEFNLFNFSYDSGTQTWDTAVSYGVQFKESWSYYQHGPNTLVFTFSDPNSTGSSIKIALKTNVIYDVPPTITLNDGNSTVYLTVGDAPYSDPGATAVDTLGNSITPIASGTVNTAAVGTYTITYTATDPLNDSSSNTATATRTVVVEPTLADYKTTKLGVLSSAFGGYTSTNYTPDNFAILTGFKDAGITAINSATDLAGVDSALSTATTAMAGVATIVDTSLATAKSAASALTPSDYADYSAVTSALAMPESTNEQKGAKTGALNGAISGLVTVSSIFTTISTNLASAGIANNLNTVVGSNWKNFSNLQFEKSILISGVPTPVGKLLFTGALDLSDSATTTFLRDLGNKLDQGNGRIAFDTRTSAVFAATGAQLTMYNVAPGVNISKLIVRNDLGTVLNTSAVVSGFTQDPDTHNVTFTAAHFTQFDIDTTPPVIAGHADIGPIEATSGSGAVVTYTAPNATDNIDATTAATCLPASGTTFAIGDTTVTCTKNDTAGNSATSVTFTVHVVDTTAPVITLAGSADMSVTYGNTYTEQGATASDIVDGTFAATLSGSVITSVAGDYTITYSAIDAHGNHATPVTRTVHVVQSIPVAGIISYTTAQTGSHTLQATNNVYDAGKVHSTDSLEELNLVITGFIGTPSIVSSTLNGTAGVVDFQYDALNNKWTTTSAAGHLFNDSPYQLGTNTLIATFSDSISSLTLTLNVDIVSSNILTLGQQYATNATTTIDSNKTEVVLDTVSGSVQNIVIPDNISPTQEITLDMSALQVGDSVTLGTNSITLERQGTNNYSALLPAGTEITGDSTWDGTLMLPKVTTLTSGAGTVNVAVEMGSTQRLNFSNAVKVVLGGMAGKNALYSDTTGEHTISACINATDTSAGSLTSGECSLSVGSDLVIWTYHFTTFAAYTPTVTSGGGGGGGSYYIPPTTTSQVLGASTGPIAGCDSRTTGFSTTTGQSCATNSSTVGQVLGASTIIGCNNGTTGFSVVTGQSCAGNSGTSTVGQVLGAESFHFSLTLKKGAKGNEVMELQKFLNAAGYDCGTADGSFGLKTKTAVTKFQVAHGIKSGYGTVGPLTRALLNK